MATKEQCRSQKLTDQVTVTAEQINSWIASRCKGKESESGRPSLMRGQGAAFVKAAQDSHLNIVYLVAHAALETAWGTSQIVHAKHNFFGIGAFDASPSESANTFDSIQNGIVGGAVWIYNNFVSKGQNTLYLMRHWEKNRDHEYATDPAWDTNIASTMAAGYDTLNQTPPEGDGSVSANEDIVESRYGVYKQLTNSAPKRGDGKIDEAKLNPIDRKPTEAPPFYYDDDFGHLKHRESQSAYFMRIGDSRFAIPPTQIRVTENSSVQQVRSLRQKQSLKFQTGVTNKTIDITLYFSSMVQINGYPMAGPGGKLFYMDGLRSLLAQMRTMPFLPIENEFLNNVYNIYAIALLNINVETVPGFPGVLKADVTFLEYDTVAFLNKPQYMYDFHFMWPLFRWHYQRKLDSRTNVQTKLRPFDSMRNISFWLINEDALKGKEADVIRDNKRMLHPEEYAAAWFDFNGVYTDAKPDAALFDEWVIPKDLVLLSVSASTGVTYTPFTLPLTDAPTYQYMGGQDTRFNLVFQTDSREALKNLTALKDEVERYSRTYRDRLVSSALRVDNNFINMFGTSHVLIETVTTETVPNMPDTFYVMLTLISFDPTQHRDESLNILNKVEALKDSGGVKTTYTTDDMPGYAKAGYDNFILQEIAAERALDQLELYPDLDLPTYDEVNIAIKEINEWRTAKSLSKLPIDNLVAPPQGRFVDPDFFFSYPSFDHLAKTVVPEAYAEIDSFLGDKFLRQMESESPAMAQGFKDNNFHNAPELVRKLDIYRKAITDSKQYEKMFLFNAWDWGIHTGQWRDAVTFSGTATASADLQYYDRQMPSSLSKEYLQGQELLARMMHDRYKYDRRGTMMRAFPTYVFVIIDEGRWINARKFWDKYYTYHAVTDINIVEDRKMPMSTAYVELANVYGSLDFSPRIGKYLPEQKGFIDTIVGAFVREVRQREIDERNLVSESAQVLAGARIHIRMGYGSTASDLPPKFNGKIAEIDTGDVVRIVAQSDGYELTNMLPAKPNDLNGLWKEGFEPSDIIRYYMTERKSDFMFSYGYGFFAKQTQMQNLIDSVAQDLNNSAYSIEHFGYLRKAPAGDKLSDFFSEVGGLFDNKVWEAEDYDIMKNIYMTTGEVRYSDKKSSGTLLDKGLADQMEKHKNDATSKQIHAYRLNPSISIKDLNIISVGGFQEGVKDPLQGELLKSATSQEGWNLPWKKMTFIEQFRSLRDVEVAIYSFNHDYKTGKERTKPEMDKLFEAICQYCCKNVMEVWRDALYKCQTIEDAKKEGKKVIDRILSTDTKKNYFPAYDFTNFLNKVIEEYWPAIKQAANDEASQHSQANNPANASTNTSEKIIRMKLTNKSPWDVYRVLERATPEYVVYPRIHNFHYTLFFGKPWWDVTCAYILPNGAKGENIKDYKELRKPFSQYHIISGYQDILSNGIKASSEALITSAVSLYTVGADQTATDPIWADYTISSSFQRTQVVDTTMVMNIIDSGLTNWFWKAIDYIGRKATNDATQWQKQAVRFGAGVIAESFKDMYQGELQIIGDPSISVYDTFYLDDFYKRMAGVAEVGRVVHSFSMETGFTTSIKADLCVAIKADPTEGDNANPSTASVTDGTITIPKWSEFALVTGSFISWATAMSYAAFRLHLVRGVLNTVKITTQLAWSALRTKSLIRGTAVVAKTAIDGIKTARNVAMINMVRVAAGEAVIPVAGWISFAVTMAIMFAVDSVFQALENLLIVKYKNVIKIFPLFYKGSPFVAGINGQQNLIFGWRDDYMGHAIKIDPHEKIILPAIGSRKKISVESPMTGGKSGAVGRAISGTGTYWPMTTSHGKTDVASAAARITQGYNGAPQSDPKHHYGIDIAPESVSKNAQIIAYSSGRIVFSGPKNPEGYGTVIIILHLNGQVPYFTLYGHSQIASSTVAGKEVQGGTQIATMSNKGSAYSSGDGDGTHLHFEVRTVKDSTTIPAANAPQDNWYDWVMQHTDRVDPKPVLQQANSKYIDKV